MECVCTHQHQVRVCLSRTAAHLTLLKGWRACEFRNREQIRMNLLLASRGVTIKAMLPIGFPTTGPDSAISWALSAQPGHPPNIILFAAALLGL